MNWRLPALTENKPLRLTTVTGMYVSQGIQLGLMLVSMPAYMAKNGVDAGAIGAFISIIMLPWTLKLFAAPIMDRFSYLPMGRRRPWVLFGLLGGAFGYFTMAMVEDPLNNIITLTWAAFIVSVFTAFMDVAIDGMVIDIVEPEEQSQANSFMWGGKVIGASATTAGTAWMMSVYGMSPTFMAASFFTATFLLLPLFFRERPEEKIFPWTSGQASEESLKMQSGGWIEIAKNLFRVVILPASLIIIAVSFLHGITYGLFDAMMPVITVQQLGWEDTAYSNLAAISGLISGVFGMLIGGFLLGKVGKINGIAITLGGLSIIGIGMALLAGFWHVLITVQSFVLLVYVFRTLVLISLFTTCMALCWRSIAATQFALYMAIGNFGISAGAAILGPLIKYFSFPQIFLVFSTFSIVAIVILRFIQIEKHSIQLSVITEKSNLKSGIDRN